MCYSRCVDICGGNIYSVGNRDDKKGKGSFMGSKFDRAYRYLKGMYADNYYPRVLVDRVKGEIEGVVGWLEMGAHDSEEVQERFDSMTTAINNLSVVFSENDSEIGTGARNAIALDVINIINYYKLPVKVNDALRLRTW